MRINRIIISTIILVTLFLSSCTIPTVTVTSNSTLTTTEIRSVPVTGAISTVTTTSIETVTTVPPTVTSTTTQISTTTVVTTPQIVTYTSSTIYNTTTKITTETVTVTTSLTNTTTANLDVYFIDVGQGDSILIDQGNTEVLIDAGTGSVNVASFIKQYVDGPIEVMVATNTDADHIGGLNTVLNDYRVLDVWTSGQTATTTAYNNFVSAIKSNGATTHLARRGDTINAGKLSFSILNPVDLSDTTGNNSVVLYLNYGYTSFLFEGDAEQEAEASMLSAGIVPHVDILKVGRHASRTASSTSFLTVVKPEIAVYMCGVGNIYQHPHQETLDNLAKIGAKVYGTDVNGTVKIATDGLSYAVKLEKQGTPKAPATTITVVSNVQITDIFYGGLVPLVESDEFVGITNLGSESVNLNNWVLIDITDGSPSFTFPSYILPSMKKIRVYTNEIHPEYGGFSFGSSRSIWDNNTPHTAALFNAQGQLVSTKSY